MGVFEEKFNREPETKSTSCLSALGYLMQTGDTDLHSFVLVNTDSATNYVKFYNVSAVANVGTDTPVMRVGVAAGTSLVFEPPYPVKFSKGLNVAATSAPGDDITASVGAGEVFGFFQYN